MAYHISDKSTVLFTILQRETEPIDIIWIQIYERERERDLLWKLVHNFMKVENFQSLLSASWRTKKDRGTAQTESKKPQITRGVDGISSHKPGFDV